MRRHCAVQPTVARTSLLFIYLTYLIFNDRCDVLWDLWQDFQAPTNTRMMVQRGSIICWMHCLGPSLHQMKEQQETWEFQITLFPIWILSGHVYTQSPSLDPHLYPSSSKYDQRSMFCLCRTVPWAVWMICYVKQAQNPKVWACCSCGVTVSSCFRQKIVFEDPNGSRILTKTFFW